MHKYLLFIVQLLIIIALMMLLGFLIGMFFPTYTNTFIIGFGLAGSVVSLIYAFFDFDRTQEIMQYIIKSTIVGELLVSFLFGIIS